MSDAVTISSAPPSRTSMDYSALRESGMALIRKWAGESWTDHNVHDPGITILEAASYAITELGLRLQLDVADLIRSGAAHGAAQLEPAHRVLPVGPITPADLRSVLLDHPSITDAQIVVSVDNEVPFYQRVATNDPPLDYAPGTPRVRVRPGGLYDTLVELDADLNSNTYTMAVLSGGQTYAIDLALPFWDDPEAVPFREGAVVTTVAMVPEGGEFWRALPESHSYFGRADVAFTGPSGPGNIVIWILLRITTALAQPAVEIPGILVEARTRVESVATTPVTEFADRVRSAMTEVSRLRSYLASWRNLGEQALQIGVARIQEIAVRARIEVTGGIDVEQLVAGIFADLHQLLSPLVRFESLFDRRRTAPDSDPDEIYDGPLLRNGFLAADLRGAAPPAVLYLSDVLRLIMRRRSAIGTDVVTQENPVGRDIVAVTDLAVTNFINNRPITSDAENCLHLVEVERYRPRLSVAKSRIVIVRNDSEVSYNQGRVVSLLNESLQQARQRARTTDTSPVWPVAGGELLPVEDYTPIQDDLPAAYGVGHAELPESAGLRRHSAVRQLQGYLLLFEQVLADVTTQVGHINQFFSGDAGENTTYFTRPLFDVPGVPNLLRRFSPEDNWETFIQDPNNPVARALHEAAESPSSVLDRRNRMLDHLLARQGEDAVAFGQELHRWAQAQLAPVANLQDQLDRIASRRDAANARLIRTKAALLRDAPELNAFRLLANSHPSAGGALLRIESTATGFHWHLAPDGQERLHSLTESATAAAASIAAEHALFFAGREALFVVVPAGGGDQRLQLMDGLSTAGQVLAESSLTFPSVAAANAALPTIAEAFATLRRESSLAPLERRVAYLTGIRSQRRRRLLTATTVHFDIFDDPPGGGLFGRRWRLTELPGGSGEVLLNSPGRFEDATAAGAAALAQASIRDVLRHGLDEWNYRIVPGPGNTFTYELKDASGTATIAVRQAPLATSADAERAKTTTIEHLYRHYSAEGFSLIEHLLLRPRRAEPAPGDPFLSLPESETPAGAVVRERDPYSQRISFVFPSGYARNFSDDTVPRAEVTPDRFRDPEFRRHAERLIQQACPAHLRPTTYWVDQTAPGTPASDASFDAWEQRYFDWLDAVLIAGAPAGAEDAARAALVRSLNAIANDAS